MLVAIGTGRLDARRFRLGTVREPAQSTADNPTADLTNSPDDHRKFLYEI